MGKKTALYEAHIALNAHIVTFAGFDLPLHYGSQMNEHHAVRRHAGIFDVSHMNIVDIKGPQAQENLRFILANDIKKLYPQKALYSCMLNEKGGVIDDLIVYMFSENHYRLILNAATKAKDIAWLETHIDKNQTLEVREDLSIIALQGPHATMVLETIFNEAVSADIAALKPFHFLCHDNMTIARTGYTGEEGFEILVSNEKSTALWKLLLNAGAHPAGLGARDSLRLEAGFNLYGQDMDETTCPFESNLGWTVALIPEERDFIGKKALSSLTSRKLTGLILQKGGVLRRGQKVFSEGVHIGEITSGGFSPTLNYAIALARIPNKAFSDVQIEIRDKLLPVQIVNPVFVRKGKPV
jgi:aminomethyltransferase